VYEIDGRIYEEHDEYQCYLSVWAAETQAKVLVFNAYESHLTAELGEWTEHEVIVHVLMSVLRRLSSKYDAPMIWRVEDEKESAGTAGGGTPGDVLSATEELRSGYEAMEAAAEKIRSSERRSVDGE